MRFHKPGTNLLVKRLKDICVEERLGADNRSLSLLAELTGGDIRSCLNALQVRVQTSRGCKGLV